MKKYLKNFPPLKTLQYYKIPFKIKSIGVTYSEMGPAIETSEKAIPESIIISPLFDWGFNETPNLRTMFLLFEPSIYLKITKKNYLFNFKYASKNIFYIHNKVPNLRFFKKVRWVFSNYKYKRFNYFYCFQLNKLIRVSEKNLIISKNQYLKIIYSHKKKVFTFSGFHKNVLNFLYITVVRQNRQFNSSKQSFNPTFRLKAERKTEEKFLAFVFKLSRKTKIQESTNIVTDVLKYNKNTGFHINFYKIIKKTFKASGKNRIFEFSPKGKKTKFKFSFKKAHSGAYILNSQFAALTVSF